VLDAWRSASVQTRLWRDVFLRLVAEEGEIVSGLSLQRFLEIGRRADDTASFCQVARDKAYTRAMTELQRGTQWIEVEVEAAAAGSGKTSAAVAAGFFSFTTNLGQGDLTLDTSANTANGNKNACDLWLIERENGAPVNLSVPYDSTSPAAVMDYFEWAGPERYQQEIDRDPGLQSYLGDFALYRQGVSDMLIESIRTERRLLFHALSG